MDRTKRSNVFMVESCPKSLKLLVQFYRYFGFSFSGIIFTYSSTATEEDKKRTTNDVAYKSAKTVKLHHRNGFAWRSTLLIVYNITILCCFSLPFWLELTTSETTSTNATYVSPIEVGIKKYQKGFRDFKPILRVIMESVIYIFILEGIFTYLINLLTGGRFIRQIVAIPEIRAEHMDSGKSLTIKLLCSKVVLILAMNVASLLMFNMDKLRMLIGLILGRDVVQNEHDVMTTKRLFFLLIAHYMNYTILSMVPILFAYTMIRFKGQIEAIARSIEKEQLNETKLGEIKVQLCILSEHFKRILAHFSVPLTLVNAANIYLIISSSCFLMISTGKRKYFASLLFNFGAFGLMRLIVVCIAGNLASSAYRELIRDIYEHVPEWNLDGWLHFIEIKRIRHHFEATLFGTYSIRQSAILSMLGFALNYIVVLLQTENYGSANSLQNHTATSKLSNVSTNS